MQSDVPSHLKCSAPSTAAAHDPRAAALASGKPSRMPVSCRIGWNSEFVFGSSSSLLNMHLVQGCSLLALRRATLERGRCKTELRRSGRPPLGPRTVRETVERETSRTVHRARARGHPHTPTRPGRPPRAMRARIVWEGRLINKTVLLKSDSLLTRSLTGGSSYVDHACAAPRPTPSQSRLSRAARREGVGARVSRR